MKIITINEITPSVVLAEDVVQANGRILLKAGVQLNDKHIKIFKTWGVSHLKIKSTKDKSIKADKKHSPADINFAIEHKRKLFIHCDLQHPFMKTLFRVCVKESLKQPLNEKD